MCKKQSSEYFAKRYLLKKDKIRKNNREWMQKRRARYHLIVLRNRAKREGLEFNLEESDIVIPSHCPYLGVKITNKQGRYKYNSSVDRINPKKGYVKGNIEVISDLANRMKQNATRRELVLFAKGILDKYSEVC